MKECKVIAVANQKGVLEKQLLLQIWVSVLQCKIKKYKLGYLPKYNLKQQNNARLHYLIFSRMI